MSIDRVDDSVLNSPSIINDETDEKLHPYHKPSLVHFGGLADLIKATATAGSDGGAPADCTHL